MVFHLINRENPITNHVSFSVDKVGEDQSGTITQYQVISDIEGLNEGII